MSLAKTDAAKCHALCLTVEVFRIQTISLVHDSERERVTASLTMYFLAVDG